MLICRLRPGDKVSPLVSVVEAESRLEVCPENHRPGPGESVHFHAIFRGRRAEAEQEELFETIRPAILACFTGASSTVFVHGGPQSGKSYTLQGFFAQEAQHGLTPRAIALIASEMERNSQISAVAASFFELQQDGACDLLLRQCPAVSLRELLQPPYVMLDPKLTASRCDAAGTARLTDAYVSGLERRRKGNHTCFQVAFLGADGKAKAYLRFVEMAWMTSRTGQILGNGCSVVSGAARAAIEQVLNAKLGVQAASNSATQTAYRNSPLALLLKPCFEGSSSLIVIHCLRLEPTQLSCLTLAQPLLTKLFLWLNMMRNGKASRAGPLKLNEEGRGHLQEPAAMETRCSSGASSDGVLANRRPQPEETGHDAVAQGDTGEEKDNQFIHRMKDFMDVKRRTAEALRQEVTLGTVLLKEMDSMISFERRLLRGGGDASPQAETLEGLQLKVFRNISRCQDDNARIISECENLAAMLGAFKIRADEKKAAATQLSEAALSRAKAVVVPQLPLSLLQADPMENSASIYAVPPGGPISPSSTSDCSSEGTEVRTSASHEFRHRHAANYAAGVTLADAPYYVRSSGGRLGIVSPPAPLRKIGHAASYAQLPPPVRKEDEDQLRESFWSTAVRGATPCRSGTGLAASQTTPNLHGLRLTPPVAARMMEDHEASSVSLLRPSRGLCSVHGSPAAGHRNDVSASPIRCVAGSMSLGSCSPQPPRAMQVRMQAVSPSGQRSAVPRPGPGRNVPAASPTSSPSASPSPMLVGRTLAGGPPPLALRLAAQSRPMSAMPCAQTASPMRLRGPSAPAWGSPAAAHAQLGSWQVMPGK